MPDPLTQADFLRIRRFMYEASGVDLAPSKQAMVEARLAKRVNQLGFSGFAEYWKMVSAPESEEERQRVINALSTNETYFFREPEHFAWLAEFARTRQTEGQPFRVWSAAASSGEEAYSAAISLTEALGDNSAFEILATDINTEVLKEARNAIYPRDEVRKLPPNFIQRYFLWGRDEYRGMLMVAPEISRRVRFQQLNLNQCERSAIGLFDVIFLRNVMIYFNPSTKESLLAQVCDKLKDDGVLVISHAETLTGLNNPLVPIRPSLYRKRVRHE